jgi:aminomethyltransferase
MFANEYLSDPDKKRQHDAVRSSVGWYLFTHEVMEVGGEDATAFLDKVCTGSISKMRVGKAKYTTMLNEDGCIIDDVIVFRLKESEYWISTLYLEDLEEWFDQNSDGLDISYQDITDEHEMYAVQGPKSMELVAAIVDGSLEGQGFFTIADNIIDGLPVKIARTGYTGELGFEIYIPKDHASILEEKLIAAGKAFEAVQVTEFQVMTLTLPSEKGYSLMCDIAGINPLEAGLDALIDWDKDFIGKQALCSIRENGPKRQLLGFEVDDNSAHIASRHKGAAGEAVIFGGEEVGRVTKFTYGFTVGKSIGFALIDNTKVRVGDTVYLNETPAVLTERIWYDIENTRLLNRQL